MDVYKILNSEEAAVENYQLDLPTLLHGIQQHHKMNKKKIKEECLAEEKYKTRPYDKRNKLQRDLHMEPLCNKTEVLMQEDMTMIQKLQSLIDSFEQVKDVEKERGEQMVRTENILISKLIELRVQQQVGQKNAITPTIFSYNIQIFEMLMMYLQTHPCYLASMIQHSEFFRNTSSVEIIFSIFGNVEND